MSMADGDDFYSLFQRKDENPHRTLASVTPIDPDRASKYARKALLSECENVAAAAEGQRNHTLNKAAFSISQLVAAGHVGEADARAALRDAATSAGLGQVEIERTLDSGFGAGAQHPRVVAEMPGVPDATILADAETTDGPPLNPILDWHALFSTEAEDEEWIVEPLLPARRMVALYSAPKAGKSLLMLEIAVAIARGTEVIGATPNRPRRVLYVDFENDPRGDIRARLEAMEVKPEQLDNLLYLSFPQLAKFDTQQGSVDLMRHVEHYQCEVVVIDTVSRSEAGEENENDTWLAFYRHTGLALKRAGIACIRLDHSGKDKDKGMRGGSAKSGDVDAVWRLTAVTDETVLLECTDHRMPVSNKTITLVREDWPLRHTVPVNPFAAVADARVQDVDAKLEALGIAPSTSYREAAKALRQAGEKVNDGAVKEAVRLRKFRLDLPAESEAASLAPHSAAPARSEAASPPPIGGERLTSGAEAASVLPHASDPDLLVGCTTCFKPTTAGVAESQGGLCATCFRDSGQVTP